MTTINVFRNSDMHSIELYQRKTKKKIKLWKKYKEKTKSDKTSSTPKFKK